MTQEYVNFEDVPLETVFLFPVDIEAVASKITIEFTLRDGSKRYLETKIEERERAEQMYEDKIAQGQTVVISMLTGLQRDMMRVNIGNFPPLSTATLKIYFYQLLNIEDSSYALRIPMTYTPRYMADIVSYINTGAMLKGEKEEELTDK